MNKPKIKEVAPVGELLDDKGCNELLEAVYNLAIHDYCAECGRASQQGEHRCSLNYISATRFLKETAFGRRLLKALDSLSDDELSRLGHIRGKYNSINRSEL